MTYTEDLKVIKIWLDANNNPGDCSTANVKSWYFSFRCVLFSVIKVLELVVDKDASGLSNLDSEIDILEWNIKRMGNSIGCANSDEMAEIEEMAPQEWVLDVLDTVNKVLDGILSDN